MFKRPSPHDTDDDLLEFQRKFLASKTDPSVKLLKRDQLESTSIPAAQKDVVTLEGSSDLTSTTTTTPPLKKSRFKEAKATTKTTEERIHKDPEAALDDADTHITKVLADIVERDMHAVPVYFPQAPAHGGFPKVVHRSQVSGVSQRSGLDTNSKKKKSLFAQQFERSSPKDFGVFKDMHASKHRGQNVSCVLQNVSAIGSLPSAPSLISGQGLNPEHPSTEIDSIHKENLVHIQSMTEDEIRTEQKKLMDALDPGLVAFLRKKKKKTSVDAQSIDPVVEQNRSAQTDNMDTSSSTTEQESEKMDTSVNIDLGSLTSVIKPSKEWINMDKLEPEKLAWLTDLPKPSPSDNKTGKPARFDLNGNLVAMDADVPTHLGLHHHGDEPERAGYTAGELFELARSAHMQQRALAIHTLAKIIRNARHGIYIGCVSTELVPAMLDGGIVVIARWALDDKTENTMVAAVNILHAIVVSPEDEEALDKVFCWYRGHEVAALCPSANLNADRTEEDNDPTDVEMLKLDLIKGLLQMSLLPRLRYILEVWRPSAAVVMQILDILIRICRHSTSITYEVVKCPRLMDTIFTEFLPLKIPDSWPDPLVSTYGIPCPRALKLIRVLCSSSRNITAHLMSKHRLMERIMLYISQAHHLQWQLPALSHNLVLECFRTWKVCVIYGLSLQEYREYYIVLVDLLQKACQQIGNPQLEQTSTCLVSLLESVLNAAATSTVKHLEMRSSRSENSTEIERKEEESLPEINWSHVAGLCQPVLLCLQQQINCFSSEVFNERKDLSLASVCLNFIASWFRRIQMMPQHNVVETLEEVEVLCDKVFMPLLKSRAFEVELANIRKNSVILSSETSRSKECTSSLPEVGSLMGETMTLCPVLKEESSLQFCLAFIRVLDSLKLHKGVAAKIYPVLLNNEEILQYLRRVCKQKRSMTVNNHFAQFENRLQQLLVNMATFADATMSIDVFLYHNVSMYLLTYIHSGSELDIHHLLSRVIFNPTMWKDVMTSTGPVIHSQLADKLHLDVPKSMTSATQHEVRVDNDFLCTDIMENLGLVRSTYMLAFGGHEKSQQLSRSRSEEVSIYPDRLLLGISGQLLVPVDWVFLPLMEIYNASCDISKSTNDRTLSPATISAVTNSLRFVYCVEAYRPGYLDSVAYSLRLSRLVCTFLASSDLFLEPSIQAYLAALLHIYCKPVALDRMNFSEAVPGLASFYDLYVLLLEQFGSVSFGDSVFASYILLPMQQRHALIFRKAIWSEYIDAVRCLNISIDQVLIPLSRFLEPEETNLEILRLYCQALISPVVTARRTPLPYLIAVHHVNRFLYGQHKKHKQISHRMWKSILRCRDEVLQQHVMYYKQANKDKQYGLELYTNLPLNRQTLMDSFHQLLQ